MADGKKRYLYIDQFRGWAVLAMIETHVLNTFLRVGFRTTLWYRVLDFVNGLVAPAFLFIAGFSLGMVALNRWAGFRERESVFWRQLLRILQIWLIGYCLRIPRFSLRQLLASVHWHRVHVFWKVDILHCIAFSLLVMLLLIPLLRRPRVYFPFLAFLGASVSLLTPICARTQPLSFLPVPLAMYVNQLSGSLFPIFPWSGFVFFGGAGAWLWLGWKERGDEGRFFRSILWAVAGIALLALLSGLKMLGPLSINFLRPYSPAFFSLRLALLLLLLAGLWFWEKRRHPAPSLVTEAGQESLLVYVGHILVIFGPFGKSLAFIIGKTRTPLEVALMAAGLVAAMLALARGWHSLKGTRRRTSRTVAAVFLAAVLVRFLAF